MATPRKLTVTDAHLAEALAGRAYLLFDGGMGTLVQAAGLHTIHEVPDLLNLTHPEAIVAIQRQYVEAGADCITTNTFSANRLKLASTDATVAEVYAAAAANARAAGRRWWPATSGRPAPLLEPLGTLTFDEAFDIFSEQACAAEAAGCDLIVVETMADLLEAKAAVLAAVESTTLPVFATMTFGETAGPSSARRRPSPPRRCRLWAPRPWGSTARWGPWSGAARGRACASRPRPSSWPSPTPDCRASKTAKRSSMWDPTSLPGPWKRSWTPALPLSAAAVAPPQPTSPPSAPFSTPAPSRSRAFPPPVSS